MRSRLRRSAVGCLLASRESDLGKREGVLSKLLETDAIVRMERTNKFTDPFLIEGERLREAFVGSLLNLWDQGAGMELFVEVEKSSKA